MPSVVVTGSTTAQHVLSDGVLYVRFSGLCTRGSLALARKHIASTIKGEVQCVVADYSAAALLLSPADVWELLTSVDPDNIPMAPAGVITGAETHDLFRRYALGAAGFSLLRRVFLGRGEALQWAQQNVRSTRLNLDS